MAEVQHATYRMLRTKDLSILKPRVYKLIFTPPYSPQLQPVELFWAHGKAYVAREFFPGRTLGKARDQLRKGFYGDPESRGKGWAAADCGALIGHAEKKIDAWVKTIGNEAFGLTDVVGEDLAGYDTVDIDVDIDLDSDSDGMGSDDGE